MNKAPTKDHRSKSNIVLGRDFGVLIAAILIAVFYNCFARLSYCI